MIATIIIMAMLTLNLGFYLAKNGQPRTDKYSFGWALLGYILYMVLFYYAGLFENFKS